MPQPFSSNWPFAAMPTSTCNPPAVHISSIRSEGARLYLHDVPNAYCLELPLVRPYADSTFFPAEQINKFAISKDEYMGGLGKELTAKKLKEEFLLSEDGYANGASDLFVLEQVNARGMGIWE